MKCVIHLWVALVVLGANTMKIMGSEAELSKGNISINQMRTMIVRDEMLLIPGVGGAGVYVGMSREDVILAKGEPGIITTHVFHDLFRDVVKLHSKCKLLFHYLYVYADPLCVIGMYEHRVSFIVAYNHNLILFDGIQLVKGIRRIVFNYGNHGLEVIKNNADLIYCYFSRGICFIDEGCDDSIDGVIVYDPATCYPACNE